MIQQQVVAQNVGGEVVFHVAEHRVDVVGPVLPVVILHHKLATVQAVVVRLRPVNWSAPCQVDLFEAAPAQRVQLIFRQVGPDAGHVLAGQRHQHFPLGTGHCSGRQTLFLGERCFGGVERDDVGRRFPVKPHLRLPEELAHSAYSIRAPGTSPLDGAHIGSGPFKFVEYVKDDHIASEQNSEYWGQVPRVDRIEYRFMPDPNTRILALQAGDVDVIFDVPPEATSLLEGLDDIQVLPTGVSASQYIMVLLTGEEPYVLTQDILVREALGYAIDREAILDVSFDGYAEASQLFSPPGVLGQYANRIVGYEYDPDRARSLLTEAGWTAPDGGDIREKEGRALTLEFINGFPAGPENGQTAEIIPAQLREVGIDLKVTNVPDNATYSNLLKDKQGDLFLEIGNQNSPSPCFLASLFYSRYETPGSYARGFGPGPLGWPQYDDAIDACNGALTTDEAAMHRADAIGILVDESRSLLPLVGITRIYAARDYVQGFDPHPVRLHVRWDALSVNR